MKFACLMSSCIRAIFSSLENIAGFAIPSSSSLFLYVLTENHFSEHSDAIR